MKFKVFFSMSGECFIHILERNIKKVSNDSGNCYLNEYEIKRKALEEKLKKLSTAQILKFIVKNNSGKPSINVSGFHKEKSKGGKVWRKEAAH